jgi:hypothetical protein
VRLHAHQMLRAHFEIALFTPRTPVSAMAPVTGLQIETLKNEIAAIDERFNRIAKALQD